MIRRIKRVSGTVLARRVCREIIRCGFTTMLGARYVPEIKVVRIGVPTANGSLDAAIDYPCEPQRIDKFIAKLRRQATMRQQAA